MHPAGHDRMRSAGGMHTPTEALLYLVPSSHGKRPFATAKIEEVLQFSKV